MVGTMYRCVETFEIPSVDMTIKGVIEVLEGSIWKVDSPENKEIFSDPLYTRMINIESGEYLEIVFDLFSKNFEELKGEEMK